MENLEIEQQNELVDTIKDGISGMYVNISISKSDYAKMGIVVGIGSAVGTGAYFGVQKLIKATKQKLKQMKFDRELDKKLDELREE